MPATANSKAMLSLVMVSALCLSVAWSETAHADMLADAIVSTELEHGFMGLYNLDFNGAQKDFSAWRPNIQMTPWVRSAWPPAVFSPSSTAWVCWRDNSMMTTQLLTLVRN